VIWNDMAGIAIPTATGVVITVGTMIGPAMAGITTDGSAIGMAGGAGAIGGKLKRSIM
jgi:hypothetical protein